MKKVILLTLSVIYISILILNSCKKDDGLVKGTDKELFELAKETSGFTWFKNSASLLNKSSGTGHAQPFLRTRYNSEASSQLNADGEIKSGAVFPEGSLIVKELYEDASTLDQYAILYKNSNSSNADANGWVWGYVYSDGKVAIKASKKGASCVSCHSQADNIDYMLMNKFFP